MPRTSFKSSVGRQLTLFFQCHWSHGSKSLSASLRPNILLTFNTYGKGKSHDLFHQEVVHHWILSKGNVNDDTEKCLTIFHKHKRHLLLRICFWFTVGKTLRGDILTLVCLYELLSSNGDKRAPKLFYLTAEELFPLVHSKQK